MRDDGAARARAADQLEQRIAEALHLRRWALPIILDAEGRIDSSEPPPAVSLPAWRLFLAGERCAIALHAAVERMRLPLPADVSVELQQQQLVELQRALSARGQLRGLAERTASHGWKLIVLKGGVEIARGGSVDVADLDILLRPDEAVALAAQLDAEGDYQPLAEDPLENGFTPGHLAGRFAPGGVQVEIHYQVRGFSDASALVERAVALPELPGVWGLHPADHLYHLLWHATEHHPDRAGRLRELYLLARSARTAEGSVLREVEARVGSLERGEEAMKQLRLVSSRLAGGPSEDEFHLTAALRYLLLGSPRLHRAPRRMRLYLGHAVFQMPRGGAALRTWFARLGSTAAQPVSSAAFRGIERRFPWLLDPFRRAVRTTFAVSMLPFAWVLVRQASRATLPTRG